MSRSPATLTDMLRAFLRAELDSPTESTRVRIALEKLRLGEEVILDNSTDTESLWQVFCAYRGREALFDGLDVKELDWYWIQLSIADIEGKTLTSINHFESLYGTRRPLVIARAWEKSGKANGVLEKVKKGILLQPPILIGDPGLDRRVILEGHNRVLSYLRNPGSHFPMPALVGTAPGVSQWCQW